MFSLVSLNHTIIIDHDIEVTMLEISDIKGETGIEAPDDEDIVKKEIAATC